jgi:hypothetical protein
MTSIGKIARSELSEYGWNQVRSETEPVNWGVPPPRSWADVRGDRHKYSLEESPAMLISFTAGREANIIPFLDQWCNSPNV